MSNTPVNDNRYPLESIVFAKENPSQKLIIKAYFNRIYYCEVASDPARKQLVYYDRELLGEE